MTRHARDTPVNRLEGLTRRPRSPITRRPHDGDPWLLDVPGLVNHYHPAWRAGRHATVPVNPGAEYRYRVACHELNLAISGVTPRQAAAVRHGVAEFALAVAGPLLVFSYRFGAAVPWSSAAPYNWHFEPFLDRVIPPAVPLDSKTYARLWSTLWITLVDADNGRARAGRAVALRPEFTYALHGVLRAQALRRFHGAAADRALDRIRFAPGPFDLDVVATTWCPGSGATPRGRPAPGRPGRGDDFGALQ